MAEAGRKAPVPSSRPSLSLPVLDLARSAREGSFLSFSRKLCVRFFINQTAFLLTKVERCQKEQPHGAAETLPDSLPGHKAPILQLMWHPAVWPTPCQTEISISDLDLEIQIVCQWYSYFLFSYKHQMQWTTTWNTADVSVTLFNQMFPESWFSHMFSFLSVLCWTEGMWWNV